MLNLSNLSWSSAGTFFILFLMLLTYFPSLGWIQLSSALSFVIIASYNSAKTKSN